jgi:hypothetical protein
MGKRAGGGGEKATHKVALCVLKTNMSYFCKVDVVYQNTSVEGLVPNIEILVLERVSLCRSSKHLGRKNILDLDFYGSKQFKF